MNELLKKLSQLGYSLKEPSFFFPVMEELCAHGNNDLYHYMRHRVDIILHDIAHFADVESEFIDCRDQLFDCAHHYNKKVYVSENQVCMHFVKTILANLEKVVMPWDRRRLIYWLSSWCEELDLSLFVHESLFLKLGSKDYRWLIASVPEKTKWDLLVNTKGKIKRERLIKAVEWSQWSIPYGLDYIPQLMRLGRLTFQVEEQRFSIDGKKTPLFWTPYIIHMLYIECKKFENETLIPWYELLLAQYHFPVTDTVQAGVHGTWIKYPYRIKNAEHEISALIEYDLLLT